MLKVFSFGIDFGTSNSLASYSNKNKKITDITICGSKIVPSSVCILKSGDIFFGSESIKKSTKLNKDVVFIRSIKRLINLVGQKDSFSYYCKEYDLGSHLSLSEDGQNVVIKAFNKEYDLFSITKNFFEKIISSIKNEFKGYESYKCVATVPAHFDHYKRFFVKKALESCGVEVMRILAEPTSAFLRSRMELKENAKCAIYDFGGGTLDVSILEEKYGVINVISTSGERFLGGEDINREILKFIKSKYKQDNELTSLLKSRSDFDLGNLCENTKIVMSNNSDKHSFLKSNDKEVILTKEEYKSILKPIFSKTLDVFKDACKDFEYKSIQYFIMCGGSSKSLVLQTMMKEYVKQFNISVITSNDPEKDVCYGAGTKAKSLCEKDGDVLIDVLPLSLGIENAYGGVEFLIERNSSIPIKSSMQFTNMRDNQTSVKIKVLQGESELSSGCYELAQFEVPIKPRRAGESVIDLEFCVDADGIMTVTATDLKDKTVKSIEINYLINLTEDKIVENLEKSFQDSQKDAIEFDKKRLMIKIENLISSVENFIKSCKKDISKNNLAFCKELQISLKDSKDSYNKNSNLFDYEKEKEKFKKNLSLFNQISENFCNEVLSDKIIGVKVDDILNNN